MKLFELVCDREAITQEKLEIEDQEEGHKELLCGS